MIYKFINKISYSLSIVCSLLTWSIMCGITGIVSFKKDELNYIGNMLNALRHRGPDGEGIVFLKKDNEICFGGKDTPKDLFSLNLPYAPKEEFKYNAPDGSFAALAHRRLSIIDLSPAAHQPMCNPNKDLWIIFNGEIYNYIELREELEAHSCVFYTNSDTEVALNSYKIWGADCVKKFNGMWSFVIYDKNKNMLFGSRDRFGVKPFYYYLDKYHFVFASEIKALLVLSFIPKKINPGVAFDYLYCGLQEAEEESFFQNIFELPPSYLFEYSFSDRSFKKWKYYALTYTDKWEKFQNKKAENYSEKIKNLIFDAVKLRLRSHVPVGSCLSGGIDSSTIVCVINNLLQKEAMPQVGKTQKAFTACYDSTEIDESKWAKIAAEAANALWYKTFPQSDEFLEDLTDLIYTQDIPFISTSVYSQYRVMKLVKENNVKVLLDGQGADELFTGYHAYYIAFFIQALKNLDISTFLREFNSLSNSAINKNIAFKSVIKNLFLLKSNVYKDLFLNKDFQKENKYRVNMRKEKAASSLNKLLFEHVTGGSLKNLLRYEDRNSMRFSIEARVPFADDINLIEYIFKIPASYKIHNGISKFLLRQSMKDLIPHQIRLRRDKIGFITPEYNWLNGIKNDIKSYFTSDLEHFINLNYVNKNWLEIFKTNPSYLWRLINFAIWKKVYCL